MMADKIAFELVSPERLLKSEPVEMVVVPGEEGDLGILPGHTPLIAAVRPGVIDIHEQGAPKERIFVTGGFCEAGPERCTVLAEEAIPVEEIEKSAAEKRLAEAADDESRRRIAEAMLAAARS